MSEDAARLITKSGVELTSECQAALVTEAENGFNPEQLVAHGPQCDCGRPVCADLSLSEPSEHLQYSTSSRGFRFMPPVKSSYEGGEVRVYESSSAEAASLWLRTQAPVNLNVPEGETVHTHIHLRLDVARRLAEQIMFLVDNHYHHSPR